MTPFKLTDAQLDAALGLPRTIAGRLETLQEWYLGPRDPVTGERGAPLIDRETYMRLADMPPADPACPGCDGRCAETQSPDVVCSCHAPLPVYVDDGKGLAGAWLRDEAPCPFRYNHTPCVEAGAHRMHRGGEGVEAWTYPVEGLFGPLPRTRNENK